MASNMDTRWHAARQHLADAAAKAGVDPAVMARIAGFESGYDPHARPIASNAHAELNSVTQFDGVRAMSSAYGYGQFTDATWAAMIRQYGEKYDVPHAEHLTDVQANAPALRNDAALQAGMLAEFTRQNVERGALLGGPDACANTYALHNLGTGAGSAFLRALRDHPGQRLDSVLSDAIVQRNPALYGDGSITIEESYRRMGQQMEHYASYAQDIQHVIPGTRDAEALQRSTQNSAHRREGDLADPTRLLKDGSRGNDVRAVQTHLNALGYFGSHGKPLHVDGRFGADTRHAVVAFQQDHHLTPDGVAGPLTTRQLHAQSQLLKSATQSAQPSTAQLNEPAHPDHDLFRQALRGVHRLDAAHARTPDQYSVNLAGALVAAAKAEGLGRIDRVSLSDDCVRAFASQDIGAGSFSRHAAVDTAQAAATPLQQSSLLAAVVGPPGPPFAQAHDERMHTHGFER